MVLLSVFSKNLTITYRNTLFSKATFVALIFGVISVVLPFIFAYKSKGFWLKRDVFFEQPDIKFRGEYLFYASTNNSSRPVIFCSTIPSLENEFEVLDACPTIKVRETDTNFDGKTDEFSLNLHVNLPQQTQITSIHIIVLVDYKLNTCPLQMQAALIFQTFFPVYVSKFHVFGNVHLAQTNPIGCHKRRTDNFYNHSVVSNDQEFNEIVTSYSKRNLSTKLANIYTAFETKKSQQFDLNLDVTYPEDKIYYKPRFWQILKWAWIQYFSIYVVVSWCVTRIKWYVFSRRLVLFYEDNPFKKKQ